MRFKQLSSAVLILFLLASCGGGGGSSGGNPPPPPPPPPVVNDDAPVMSSANTASVAENSTAVLALTATDSDSPDADLSFTLGGTDASLFNIVSTNRLVFRNAPDFEDPQCGSGSNQNSCQITITPSDGTNTGTAQAISITVTDVDETTPGGGGTPPPVGEAPVMTSADSANLNENTSPVLINLTASDSDSPAADLSFALGGTDASAFTITSANALMFSSAPDAETICTRNAASNAVCGITVTPSDGTNTGIAQTIIVTVTNLDDEAPVMSSANSASVLENSVAVLTLTATDADNLVGQTQEFSLTGSDAGLFSIINDDELVFNSAPDFETPICGGDNSCQIAITPDDGTNTGTPQAIAVMVVNANDIAPMMSSASTANVAENSVAVLTLTATDADNLGAISFNLGGTDASLFNIVSTNRLVFKSAPNFETPICGGDNVCQVTITPSDGTNTGIAQAIIVTVTNLNDEAPVMNSPNTASAPENTLATALVLRLTATDADNITGQSQSFSLGGSDASLFSISGSALTFSSPPDAETICTRNVADGSAVCEITVTPSDGTNTGIAQAIIVTVTNLNDEAPIMTSPNTASVLEDSVAVLTLTATDADNLAGQTQQFSLAGTDASLFSIINDDELVFSSAPDFETPMCGSGTDQNSCQITITPTDGTNSGVAQTISITINDIPNLRAFDSFVVEGYAGVTTTHLVPVYLPHGTASVDYTIIGSTALVADNDFTATITTGTLNFSAGGTQSIAIQIIGDSKKEEDEIILIRLHNPVNLEIVASLRFVDVIIIEDDTPIHNDSGVLYSGNSSSGNASNCSRASQDCAHGRDADSTTDTFVKVGGGQAGFDFTKLAADGTVLVIQTATYSVSGTEAAGTKWSCVRDNHTSLVWQVQTDESTANEYDKDNTYQWGGLTALGREPEGDRRGTYRDDWNNLVLTANDATNAGANGLCGFTNWRVPKVLELLTIAHSGRESPSIDTNYFPNTQDFSDNDEAYWSATPVNRINASAWAVTFANGANAFNNSNRTLSLRVRLVRRGDFDNSVVNEWPDSRYTITADNTVIDTRTNLMWQRCSIGQDQTTAGCTGTVTTNHTWGNALTRPTIASNQIAGFTDWRLPNVRELLTLVAYDSNRPAINSTIFPRTEHSSAYASSTPTPIIDSSNLVNRFYNVNFGDGADNPNSRRNFAGYAVRLVRDVD